jgi:hypothetical protein
MTVGEQIVFSGTTFGGLSSSTPYYIYNILGNQIVVSATYNGTPQAVSNATGSMTAVAGGMLGGLTAGQIYYVIASNLSSSGFSVSLTPGGSPETISTQTFGSSMQIHTIGWENLIPGTPAANTLDTTTVYSVEPCVRFTEPIYSSTSTALQTSTNWVANAYGGGRYVAISSAGLVSYSTNGQTWVAGASL